MNENIMKYGIKCIIANSKNPPTPDWLITDRGVEVWCNGYDKDGAYGKLLFDSINEAFQAREQKWKDYNVFRYLVEEYPS